MALTEEEIYDENLKKLALFFPGNSKINQTFSGAKNNLNQINQLLTTLFINFDIENNQIRISQLETGLLSQRKHTIYSNVERFKIQNTRYDSGAWFSTKFLLLALCIAVAVLLAIVAYASIAYFTGGGALALLPIGQMLLHALMNAAMFKIFYLSALALVSGVIVGSGAGGLFFKKQIGRFFSPTPIEKCVRLLEDNLPAAVEKYIQPIQSS